jgi:hypothetical protein
MSLRIRYLITILVALGLLLGLLFGLRGCYLDRFNEKPTSGAVNVKDTTQNQGTSQSQQGSGTVNGSNGDRVPANSSAGGTSPVSGSNGDRVPANSQGTQNTQGTQQPTDTSGVTQIQGNATLDSNQFREIDESSLGKDYSENEIKATVSGKTLMYLSGQLFFTVKLDVLEYTLYYFVNEKQYLKIKKGDDFRVTLRTYYTSKGTPVREIVAMAEI